MKLTASPLALALTGLAFAVATAAQAQFAASKPRVAAPPPAFHPAPVRSSAPTLTQHVGAPAIGRPDFVRSTGGLPQRAGGGMAPYRPSGSFGPNAPRPGMAPLHGPYARPGMAPLNGPYSPQSGGHYAGGFAAGRLGPAGTHTPYMPGTRPAFSQRQFAYHGQSFAAVHAPAYRFTRGYNYRPFAIGMRFPGFLLLSDYFLTDYYLYNLAPPPGPGIMWVRFGSDALLVNTYSGEVVDTAPGLFDDTQPPSDTANDEPPQGYAPQPAADPGYPGPGGLPMPPQ